MSDGHILFDNVSKRFHRGPAHDSLRDLIPALVRRIKPGTARSEMLREGDFWAVHDVSFEVGPGQALGIIGGNGAGKSTALKLLTKVLTPTRGRAEVRGRAGALIEVSAGFHPDLTGRENVFLQGAIMGMPQKLIRERFDEIVEFSGVSAFVDTPVKRYSSGMNARLGFSIAVHLEPDVLIVDEVLSVGDAEFQARAFAKIKGLVKGNIPVVIVSHQLDRIVELCTECILLQHGQVAFRGTAQQAVHEYLHGTQHATAAAALDAGPPGIVFQTFTGPDPALVPSGETCRFALSGELTDVAEAAELYAEIIVVDATTNQRLYSISLNELGRHPAALGGLSIPFELRASLPPGLYRLETSLWHDKRKVLLGQGPVRLFQVVPGRPFRGSHQLSVTVV